MKWTKESKKKRPTKEEIVEVLKRGVVALDFIKDDGSLRFMNATLMESALPPKKEGTKKINVANDEVIRCLDFNLGEWRSFKIDSLVSIEL